VRIVRILIEPSPNESTNDSGKEQLRALEGGILDLIVEVAPLVVANEVGADVLVAGTLGRLGLMLETPRKAFAISCLKLMRGY
jgi:hypothetical protein